MLYNLYLLTGRHALIVVLGLLRTRFIYIGLSEDGFGQFQFIYSFIFTGAFVAGVLSILTNRYIAWNISRNDSDKGLVLSTAITLAILSATILIPIIEILWENFSNIYSYKNVYPNVNSITRFWGYMFLLLTFIQSPLTAVLTASEEYKAYAKISLFEQIIIFLGITSCYLSNSLSINLVFIIFCSACLFSIVQMYTSIRSMNYEGLWTYKKEQIRNEIINMWGFLSWSLFGQVTTALRSQGITALIGSHFKTSVVSSRAISLTILLQFNALFNTMSSVLAPKIVRLVADDQLYKAQKVAVRSGELLSGIGTLLAIIVIYFAKDILFFWLGDHTRLTVSLVYLVMIEFVLQTSVYPLTVLARAKGKLRRYELILGSAQLLLFVSIAVLIGRIDSVEYIYVYTIVISVLMYISRIRIISRIYSLKIQDFASLFLVVFLSLLIVTCAALLEITNVQNFIVIVGLISFSTVFSVLVIRHNLCALRNYIKL